MVKRGRYKYLKCALFFVNIHGVTSWDFKRCWIFIGLFTQRKVAFEQSFTLISSETSRVNPRFCYKGNSSWLRGAEPDVFSHHPASFVGLYYDDSQNEISLVSSFSPAPNRSQRYGSSISSKYVKTRFYYFFKYIFKLFLNIVSPPKNNNSCIIVRVFSE